MRPRLVRTKEQTRVRIEGLESSDGARALPLGVINTKYRPRMRKASGYAEDWVFFLSFSFLTSRVKLPTQLAGLETRKE